MSEPILKVKDFTVEFWVDGVWYPAAVDMNFELEPGRVLAIVGESGSGKSTIARMIMGLLAPTAGRIWFDGQDMSTLSPDKLRELRRRFQIVFQNPFASLNPRWRVGAIIGEPILTFGLASAAAVEREVARLLEIVGLSAQDAKKFPHEFSGGQRQRIAIARALSSRPEFIVFDEPTSALDVSVQAQILNLMRDLQDQFGLTYLLISHDLSVVRHMATQVGVLYLGRLVEVAQARALFDSPQHPYTRMLLDAVPDLTLSGIRRTPIRGEIPNPISPPSGCAFHPRCPIASTRCTEVVPTPVVTASGIANCLALMDKTEVIKNQG